MNNTARLRPDGFRERGGEVTRMEAFVDAAFAFALTMLVISVGTIPDNMPRLLDALKGTPAFAASFALIARFWYEHVTWSRRYGLDDRGSILLSLLLVFLVMVFIYPLKAVFATGFHFFSGGWLPSGFTVESMDDVRLMFLIYGLVYGTMSIVVSLLYLRAWRQRTALELSLDEAVATAGKVAVGLMQSGVALLSIAVAYGIPEHAPVLLVGMPGMLYALVGFSGMLSSRVARSTRARLLGSRAG